MADNKVKLTNGHRWTAQQFVDHYRSAEISGTPVPVGDAPGPVPVDMSWYMGEGPGRFYHPGMFKVISRIAGNRKLAPGTHDLEKLADTKDDLKASISHYVTAPWSSDYALRALVFGNESAKIEGKVVVNPDGSKRFERVEIRPHQTGFDFWPKNGNKALEAARAQAKRYYDPEDRGVGYDISITGTGRVYDPFTDAELNAAVHGWGSKPPGLLPSATQHRPLPYVDEHRQYLDYVKGLPAPMPQVGRAPEVFGGSSVPHLSRRYHNSPTSVPGPSVPIRASMLPGSSNDPGGLAEWFAKIAGVNPQDPMRAAASPQDDQLREFYRDDAVQPWTLQRRR
jgi:hypothetical protein